LAEEDELSMAVNSWTWNPKYEQLKKIFGAVYLSSSVWAIFPIRDAAERLVAIFVKLLTHYFLG